MSARHQTRIGLALMAAIVVGWAATHLYALFLHPLSAGGLIAAPLLVVLLAWLNVGLFIIAHDCMHGSLAPRRPALNRWVGRVALTLYAGFSYDRLQAKHFLHHKSPGTGDDPDFSTSHSSRFWGWYLAFLRRYFGLRELATLIVLSAILLWPVGIPLPKLLLFWALPAILSSLQLFLFGTYLPHRVDPAPFADRHRARSNGYNTLASLLTCFHFGYHHEHHLAPHQPWWRLPGERARRLSEAQFR